MWTYSSGPRSCLGRELSLASKRPLSKLPLYILDLHILVIKTVLVDKYTRYKTTLLEPDRTEKRPWESADFMAEVRFENILACEEGEWIEKRVRKPSLSPVEAQEQIQEPVRRRSIFQPDFNNFTFTPADENNDQEATVCPSRRPLAAQIHVNLDPFAKDNETPAPRQVHFDLDPPVKDKEIIASHQQIDARAWLGRLNTARKPSLVPSLLDQPIGAQGQKGGEQREEISRRPSMMPMDEEEGIAPLEKPVVRAARPRRPMLKHRSTAPERVDEVLQGN